MDDARYEELTKKRASAGLSDDEAAELGRLMAEREGQTYESATDARAENLSEMDEEEAEARQAHVSDPVRIQEDEVGEDSQAGGGDVPFSG